MRDQDATVRIVLLVALLCGLTSTTAAQVGRDNASPSACWRVSFGEWAPPLDWGQAGHSGSVGATARSIRRIRDSVFARDTVASAANAMTMETTARGALLVLYPSWWPAGVEVTFDSTLAGGTEMLGTAIAMVADARRAASRARARAWQVACGTR